MTPNCPVVVVCATQVREDLFSLTTYLGRSLERVPEQMRPRLRLFAGNTGAAARGLGDIYNEAIDTASEDDVLVLVHDDVYINDWCITQRVLEAVDEYDVVGLAGSCNPDFSHPSWVVAFDADLKPLGQQVGLEQSGVVNHYDHGHPSPNYYGPSPRACELVDGLFLAGKVSVWRSADVRFDPQFRFHMYDLDFSRIARAAGLAVGTWPISVTHDSGGVMETEAFRTSAAAYLAKWE